MDVVTISPKYQVVIPFSVRRSPGLKPGQKVQVVSYGDRIELIPILPARKARGFLKGIDTRLERDTDPV
jgi:AbrB family looped-hinge helix DNA binding protein